MNLYIRVRPIAACNRILTYRIPPSWPDPQRFIGSLVIVPLQKRTICALVIDVSSTLTKTEQTYAMRDALSYEDAMVDERFKCFVHAVAHYYALDDVTIYRRLITGLVRTQKQHTAISLDHHQKTKHIELSEAQQAIVNHIHIQLANATAHQNPTLIHGVTGSGKSEVYAAIMAEALAQGKSCIFLIPDVSLAVQFVAFFRARLGHGVYGYHSATSAQDKRKLWNAISTKEVCVVIGVHLPIFLPVHALGLIIVDEEHEIGYQEKQFPRLNTREVALMRAQTYQVPIVLGSATPSIHAYAMVEQARWSLFELKDRFFSTSLPAIQIVHLIDRTQRTKKRTHFWFSEPLLAAINKRIEQKEQSIIFLNRRGYSFFVQCSGCGHITTCPSCAVSLTVHKDINKNTLKCHYCQHEQPYPTICNECNAKQFIDKGIGTQQVVSLLEELFPLARIARADLDTTVDRKRWQETMRRMMSGEIDILVGTQTITRGYHFPRLTLVGVLWADSGLSFPFYNAAEVGLQQLIQVAGRAGREISGGEVIVQTMEGHPVLAFLDELRYRDFFEHEKKKRELFGYPPYVRFAEIEFRHIDEQTAKREANACAEFIRATFPDITVLGPADPPIKKIKSIYMQKMYLKAQQFGPILQAYQNYCATHASASQVFFTPSPMS